MRPLPPRAQKREPTGRRVRRVAPPGIFGFVYAFFDPESRLAQHLHGNRHTHASLSLALQAPCVSLMHSGRY